MPAKSKSQQRFMGMVHAVQSGELDPSDAPKSVVAAAKDMKKSDVKDFAETKHKGLPEEVKTAKLMKKTGCRCDRKEHVVNTAIKNSKIF